MKQVLIVNTALKMPTGKLAAQVAHASQFSASKAGWLYRLAWRFNGAYSKVVLAGGDANDLEWLAADAETHGLPFYLVRDAGRTVLEPGTITCLGIGPAENDKIDKVTGSLKLLR